MRDIYFQEAKRMARAAAFHDLIKKGIWNGYTILEPTFSDSGEHIIGIPQYILYKDGKLRWTKDVEESFSIMESVQRLPHK